MRDVITSDLPSVAALSWRDDGQKVFGTLSHPYSSLETIVEWDVKSGLGSAIAKGELLAISPNGKWITYVEDGRWWLRSVSIGATPRPIGATPDDGVVPSKRAEWSPDSRYVALGYGRKSVQTYGENSPSGVIDVGADTDARLAALKPRPTLQIFDTTAKKASRFYDLDGDILGNGHWTNDQYYYVVIGFRYPEREGFTSFRVLDANESSDSELFRASGGTMQNADIRGSFDNKSAALVVDVDGRQWDDFLSILIFDRNTKKIKRITTKHNVRGMQWAGDGKSIYFTTIESGLDPLYLAQSDGKIFKVFDDQKYYHNLAIRQDGYIAVASQDGYGQLKIVIGRQGTPRKRELVTISDPGREFRLGKFETVTWKGDDKLSLNGFLVFPPDYDPNKKYPLLVDIHGGGPGARLVLYSLFGMATNRPLDWHAWAASGYVVFVPDMRSSGAAGPGPALERYAQLGGVENFTVAQDARDVVSGINHIVSHYLIDKSRMVLFGHSAGGGRAAYLLDGPVKFAAAIIHEAIPLGDLTYTLLSTTGDYAGRPITLAKNGKTLGQSIAAYTDNFLFKSIRSETPTLIMVGNPRRGAIAPFSSEVLFSTLRTRGVPTRMLRFTEDGHVVASPASGLQRYREMKGWLDRYAPGGAQ